MGVNLIRKAFLSILFTIVLSILLCVTPFLRYPYAENRNYALNLGVQEYTNPAEAIDFTLKDIENKKVSLKNYRGKIVMLNFWATWCIPCRLEMPSMEKLYKQFKDKGLVVLSVATGERAKSVNAFIKEYNITFPALLDSNLEVSDNYNVWALPTTYFVNAEGKIIGKVNGGRNWGTKEADQYITSIF